MFAEELVIFPRLYDQRSFHQQLLLTAIYIFYSKRATSAGGRSPHKSNSDFTPHLAPGACRAAVGLTNPTF